MGVKRYFLGNFGSLKSATVGIFTPWMLASAPHVAYCFSFSSRLSNIYQHAIAHHYRYELRVALRTLANS